MCAENLIRNAVSNMIGVTARNIFLNFSDIILSIQTTKCTVHKKRLKKECFHKYFECYLKLCIIDHYYINC